MRLRHFGTAANAGKLLAALAATAMLATPLVVTPASAATNGNNSAYIRLVNAVPGATAVNVFIDNTRAVAQLTYSGVTSLIAVPSGKHHIQIGPCGNQTTGAGAGAGNGNGNGAGTANGAGNTYAACLTTNTNGNGTNQNGSQNCASGGSGNNRCLVDQTVSLSAGKFYTVAIVGNRSGSTSSSGKNGTMQMQLKLLPAMGLNDINQSRAALRFVNLSPDAPAFDIAANGLGTVFQNIHSGNASNTTTVNPSTYTFIAYPASGSTSMSKSSGANGNGQRMVISTVNTALMPGHTYAIYLLGSVMGSANNQNGNGNANSNGNMNMYGPTFQGLRAIIVDTTPQAVIWH